MSTPAWSLLQGYPQFFEPARAVWVALGMAALGGCTTLYEGKYDIEQGWREAAVVAVGPAVTMKKSVTGDCRVSASAREIATSRFAMLSYRWMGRTLHRVVPLAFDAGIKTGDLVYVNVLSCTTPPARRTAG